MKKIEFTFHVRPELEPYLDKVIEANRVVFRDFGVDVSDKSVIDMILYEALIEECEKYGYKG